MIATHLIYSSDSHCVWLSGKLPFLELNTMNDLKTKKERKFYKERIPMYVNNFVKVNGGNL